MASNFRISMHRDSDSLHLKLIGDFDGSSACELIDLLKKTSFGIRKVFIHTNSLKNIYPFGRDIFQKNMCDLNGKPIRILFTGENADEIAPEKSLCM